MNMMDRLPHDLEMSPQAVSSYLGVAGWQLVDTREGVAQIWELEESGATRARVMLPLDTSYADFSRRFDETLRRLCRVYDWDIDQLALNIASARADFLYIRADQTSADGSIPLVQAESLISGAADMLLFAACSAVAPRSHYKGRRPDSAKEFVKEDVRMGHTQRGSFIITILTHLGEEDVIEEAEFDERQGVDVEALEDGHGIEEAALKGPDLTVADPDDEWLRRLEYIVPQRRDAVPRRQVRIPPFQRRVMARLATGVSALREVALGTGSIGVDDAVARGLSANLVEAVERMTKFEGLRSLDLSFSWAPTLQTSPVEVQNLQIDRDVIPELPPLQRRLERKPPEPSRVTIFGRVFRLERGEGESYGVVTIRGMIEKSTRRQVKVSLSGENYNTAIQAHRKNLPVAVSGLRVVRGGTIWLEGDVSIEAGF